MALQKQVIPIPFAGGVDTKSDPKQVVPGKLLSLFNGVFQSTKRILKRFGYNALSRNLLSGGSITAGFGLKSYLDELVLLDGRSLFTYTKNSNAWFGAGNFYPSNVKSKEIVSITDPLIDNDSAYSSFGYYGFSYITNSAAGQHKLFLTITDASSGNISFTSQVSTNTIIGAKVVAIGNFIVVIYQDNTAHEMRYFAVNVTTNMTTIGPVTIATDIAAAPIAFDVCVVNDYAYLAYESTGGTKVAFYFLSPTLVLSSRMASAGGGDTASVLTITGDSSHNIWLTYNFANSIKTSIYTEFIAAGVLSPTVIDTLAGVENLTGIVRGTTGYYYYTSDPTGNQGNTKTQFIQQNSITIGGVVGTPSVFLRSVCNYARPFIVNNQIFVPTVYSNPLQPTIFVVSEFGVVVSKVLNQDVQYTSRSLLPNTVVPLPNSNMIDANTVEISDFSSSVIGSGAGGAGGSAVGTLIGNSVTSSTLLFNQSVDSATLANTLHLSGGILIQFDGNLAAENGFNVYPDYVTLTNAGGGGSLSAGSYEYAIIYEWIDSRGNHHRSSPSPFASITVAAGDKVNVVGPMLRVTSKTNVIYSIYRTNANGTTLRRISGFPLTSNNYNDPTVDSFTYLDNTPDSDQAAGDILYTTGGEVPNIGPPSSNYITTFRSRMILLPSESNSDFWYSKEIVPNFPVEFSQDFTQSIDELGGDMVAAIQMDDKLVIFKPKNVFYMTGQGPADSGANNDFSTPLLINSDVGCSDPFSVVLMPSGVMFKSSKGIYLLDRSLQASYIGAEVEAYNAFTVTSAQLMKAVNQVRFTLSSGVCLVYDYYFNQWSVFSNIAAVDSCIFEGNFSYLKSDGTVMEETPGAYMDNGTFIPLSLETSWLSMAGIQGFQRIYKALLLGEQKGNHKLQVQTAFDFDSTIRQTDLIDATAIAPAVYQWRIFPIIQKCEAIKLLITDVQTSGFNEGYSISDLTLEVGTKTGADKLPASQSFG